MATEWPSGRLGCARRPGRPAAVVVLARRPPAGPGRARRTPFLTRRSALRPLSTTWRPSNLDMTGICHLLKICSLFLIRRLFLNVVFLLCNDSYRYQWYHTVPCSKCRVVNITLSFSFNLYASITYTSSLFKVFLYPYSILSSSSSILPPPHTLTRFIVYTVINNGGVSITLFISLQHPFFFLFYLVASPHTHKVYCVHC